MFNFIISNFQIYTDEMCCIKKPESSITCSTGYSGLIQVISYFIGLGTGQYVPGLKKYNNCMYKRHGYTFISKLTDLFLCLANL